MSGKPALSDVKVLDLMWVIAGPSTTRIMADYGATIVRVESQTRIETARTIGPFRDGVSGTNTSGAFDNYNAGKLGITLDLSNPNARAVVRDLVRWADIVTESFSPRAMRSWDLDYESLRKINPTIIMLSTCLFGQSGPLSAMAGYGTMGSAISGFVNIAGWPDRAPVGPFGAYTDYLAPRFSLVAILAALDHRNRTGEGVYIDQAQAESAMHFMSTALLDYDVNGNDAYRLGNRDQHMAPHGVFPTNSKDMWIAIAARNNEDWNRLSETIGQAELASDDRFKTLEKRKEHEDALEEIVTDWTSRQDALEIECILQTINVPAHVVQNASEIYEDPQLQHRNHFVELTDAENRETVVEGNRTILSRTPASIERSAPPFGRDNEYVLKNILGYSDEKLMELAISGALE